MPGDINVCIIDDDEAIRESLRLLLYAAGISSVVFASANDFLTQGETQEFHCMLLDIRMPGMDGLELFGRLRCERVAYPVIFITGHGDIPVAVAAIKQGAFDFLTKPFKDGELLRKVRSAVAFYSQQRLKLKNIQDIKRRTANCTPREQEVMRLMVQGLPNKGIGESLNISSRTVEIHRAHVMEKMEADSLPALVYMITQVGSFPDGAVNE